MERHEFIFLAIPIYGLNKRIDLSLKLWMAASLRKENPEFNVMEKIHRESTQLTFAKSHGNLWIIKEIKLWWAITSYVIKKQDFKIKDLTCISFIMVSKETTVIGTTYMKHIFSSRVRSWYFKNN